MTLRSVVEGAQFSLKALIIELSLWVLISPFPEEHPQVKR